MIGIPCYMLLVYINGMAICIISAVHGYKKYSFLWSVGNEDMTINALSYTIIMKQTGELSGISPPLLH